MKRIGFGLLMGLALVVSGCADSDLTTTDNTTTDSNSAENAKPSDVEDGDVPVGKQITLTGDVKKIYDDRTFAMSDDGIDFEDDLIIVTKEKLPFTADDDQEVRVTGTVKAFTVTEAENDYDWDFDNEVETELETDIEYYLADAKIELVDPNE